MMLTSSPCLVADGKFGCPLERSGSPSPSASEGRWQRLGMAPHVAAEHKSWVERTAEICFSQPCSPPFPLPDVS